MSSISVNPEFLILARESRGLTQKTLAARAGISQGHLSKYETGIYPVPPEHLTRISEALDYDPGLLSWKTDSDEGTLIFHRKQKSLQVREQDRIRANFKITRMQVSRLFNGVQLDDLDPVGIPNIPLNTPAEAEGSPDAPSSSEVMSRVEDIAVRVRKAWRLPSGPIPNLTALIEKAGGVVARFPMGNHRCDGLSQSIGRSSRHVFFFISSDIPGDRYRYTLAHELGHMVMHQDPEPGWDIESQANRFAGAFLLPAKEFAETVQPFSLSKLVGVKHYWKVSIQAMIQRAHALRIISDRERGNAFIRVTRLGYRTEEPIKIPQEEPALLRDVVNAYRSSLDYSNYELAKLVGLTVPGLTERFLLAQGSFRMLT
jgi:Zn-dependent peptidase ImmA (M78 family)/transcriptional regulator with XRE-family HTH domain